MKTMSDVRCQMAGGPVARLVAFLGLLLIASVAIAQGVDVPDTARMEVARRGAMVEVIDQNVHDEGIAAAAEALAVPADDSNKWFLTVIVGPNCAPCERLKKDLETSPVLEKWVKLERIKQAGGKELLQSTDESYLHVNFEAPKDPLRPERFAGIKITAYPTILIQTPLDGKWGKPGLVVNQRNGYDGKPELLEQFIKKSIEDYSKQYAKEGHRASGANFPERAETEAASGGDAVAPPPFPLPSSGTDVPVLDGPADPDLYYVGPAPAFRWSVAWQIAGWVAVVALVVASIVVGTRLANQPLSTPPPVVAAPVRRKPAARVPRKRAKA